MNVNASRILMTVSMLFASAMSFAQAPDEPVDMSAIELHSEAYVKGPSVFLSDIAQIEGDSATVLGDIELTYAASPGRSKRVDAALVRSKLMEAGVDPANVQFKGAHSVVATTRSLDITRDAISEDLRSFIMSEMPWDPADASVDVMPPAMDITVPDGDMAILWQASPQYRWFGPATFRGEIHVDGAHERTIVAKANVDAYVDVVVAARDLPRGKLIQPTDLTLEKYSLTKLQRGPLRSIAAAVGSVARNPIFPGQVITDRDLRPRVVIKRNEMATVKTSIGGLMVTGRARALMDGHAGDVIMLENPQSKREVTGVVQADGTVIVD